MVGVNSVCILASGRVWICIALLFFVLVCLFLSKIALCFLGGEGVLPKMKPDIFLMEADKF